MKPFFVRLSQAAVAGSLVLGMLLAASCAHQATTQPVVALPDNSVPEGVHSQPTGQKWLFLMTNLANNATLEKDIALVKRAGKDGYDHVHVADFKFMKWDFLGQKYADNVHKFMDACHEAHIQVWAAVAPLGYANELLVRDPNLAEGLPVKDATFVVGEALMLKPEEPELKLVNGSFADVADGKPAGWTGEALGKSIFIDKAVTWEGKPTLRIDTPDEVDPKNGGPGLAQTIAVKPFHYYHVHAMIKTEGTLRHRGVKIDVLADDHTPLNFQTPVVPASSEWMRFDMTFDSLEFSKVALRLTGRPGKGGKIWWADLKIEPGDFVNVVRRDGTPLRVTSLDGKTVYKEGVDFCEIKDPLLGYDPGAGGFTIWHQPPPVYPLVGSRLHAGNKVSINYYVTEIIHDSQVMCCMSEPKTMQLIEWQIHQMHQVMNPDGYFMGFDELRVQGYDQSCVDSHMTMAQLLADRARMVTRMIQKEAPGKPIGTWSDLFDPFHNAAKDIKRYYLVNFQGSPWFGSWEGLSKDVVIFNWHGFDKNRMASLKFFADRGNKQILCGYYDHPDKSIYPWLNQAAHVAGVEGVMYCTWVSNFDDMENFMSQLNAWKLGPATTQETDK